MDALEGFFELPVNLHTDAGPPSFHVFDHLSGEKGHVHFDYSYQKVRWPEPFSNPFSFTLLLKEPSFGAGLSCWFETVPPDPPERTLIYKIGHLYVHSGRFLHAIAGLGKAVPGEYRITLQGHGALLHETNRIVVYC
jgi:hypothetical protein